MNNSFKNGAAAIEAILFASGEPVSLDRLALALEMMKEDIEKLAVSLEARLDMEDSGIRLVRIGDKLQLVSKSEFADQICSALETRKPPALSAQAMETLSVVAYRQPVTKAYIEQVRGVESSYTVNSLAEKGFIEPCGRLEAPGRPVLYKTTDMFLRVFGLASLLDLPPLGEELADGQMTLSGTMDGEAPAEN
ncbi:MAG: SMC-Scp complex subunit ScpB [Ruminococcaceae bacterium]|nr:SMC-Scp complex subunit ScpB [Oscillospiraceae bacterium]MBQ8899044.1 SMC-Scp complex subunit ScpB [Clostridia bacterium]